MTEKPADLGFNFKFFYFYSSLYASSKWLLLSKSSWGGCEVGNGSLTRSRLWWKREWGPRVQCFVNGGNGVAHILCQSLCQTVGFVSFAFLRLCFWICILLLYLLTFWSFHFIRKELKCHGGNGGSVRWMLIFRWWVLIVKTQCMDNLTK